MTRQPPDQDSRPRDTAAAEKPEAGATAASERHRPGGGGPAPTPAPGDLAALLLELLRKINAEVPGTAPLQGRAEDAVATFARIADDLRTLADGPVDVIGPSNRSKRA